MFCLTTVPCDPAAVPRCDLPTTACYARWAMCGSDGRLGVYTSRLACTDGGADAATSP